MKKRRFRLYIGQEKVQIIKQEKVQNIGQVTVQIIKKEKIQIINWTREGSDYILDNRRFR